MFHRMLSLLLIGATVLGPSICCCTMKVASAESSAPKCCCCQKDDTAKQCPGSSDGNREHECPCQKHRAVGVRLDDSLILQTSPWVKWIIELSDLCSPVLFRQTDEVPPRAARFLPGRCPPMLAGRTLLIAHNVSRC
jgi:hypothetical protein